MLTLTKEEAFFLETLKAYVHTSRGNSPYAVDGQVLASLAKAQQLSAIIFYQTRLPSLAGAYACATYYAVNRIKLLEKIDPAFRSGGPGDEFKKDAEADASIPYMIFKGAEVAQYFPHPNLRMSGDIDLLVAKAHKERAGKILEASGFVQQSKGEDHEWCYRKGEFEIELHHRLLYDDDFNETVLTAFTDTVWEHVTSADGCRCHLEAEFHFVFLLLHLRKHFLWAGVGIRQFLDLAMMAKNGRLDWKKVEGYIKSCGTEKFASVCFALMDRWFGVSVPLQHVSLSEVFYCRATKRILAGTAFGDMSPENLRDHQIMNATHKHGRLRLALAVLFPPYEQLKTKYPGMARYKALLPVLWLRRMVDALLHHSAQRGLGWAGKYLSASDQESREELQAWGLR